MVKHTETIRRQKPTNCLSVFEHFVGLALKGLTKLRERRALEEWQNNTNKQMFIFLPNSEKKFKLHQLYD